MVREQTLACSGLLHNPAESLVLTITLRPQDVIIFMIGGTTYEEARTVALLNQDSASTGTRILLGGTCVHNSSRYFVSILVLIII